MLTKQAYLKEKGLTVPIEVEVRSLEEVREMAEALDGDRATSDAEAEALPVTRVMLDNMARLSPDHPGLLPSLYRPCLCQSLGVCVFKGGVVIWPAACSSLRQEQRTGK